VFYVSSNKFEGKSILYIQYVYALCNIKYLLCMYVLQCLYPMKLDIWPNSSLWRSILALKVSIHYLTYFRPHITLLTHYLLIYYCMHVAHMKEKYATLIEQLGEGLKFNWMMLYTYSTYIAVLDYRNILESRQCSHLVSSNINWLIKQRGCCKFVCLTHESD
jgi:hypothetical protein